MKYVICLLWLLSLTACSSYKKNESLTSIQLLDRNGFSETISSKERLHSLQKVDFSEPQPYQKVLRVFNKEKKESPLSKVTTYHPNGHLWQYLEIKNGRAHGKFQEWYPSGALKIDATVIEGIADIHEQAQLSWVFEGENCAWSEEGILLAKMYYEKGSLEGASYLYHPTGALKTILPYLKNELEGTVISYDPEGEIIETSSYVKGVKEGSCSSYWNKERLKSSELFSKGHLLEASYFTKTGELLSSIKEGSGKQAIFQEDYLEALVEYKEGKPEGKVELFSKEGALISSYETKEGKKNGEEIAYFPGTLTPKLSIEWRDDSIEGFVKTWYKEGGQESQKEMHKNKKNGHTFAWYKTGDLMLMEEYEEDLLIKGSYFKKKEKNPISKVEKGTGVATLFDADGHLIQKVSYQKGEPQL